MIESTTNGMSSDTTSITVCGDCHPSVPGRGVHDPDEGGTYLAPRREPPVRLGRAGEILDPERLEVVERGLGVVAADEVGDARRFAGRHERGGESTQSVEEVRAGVLERRRHQSEGTPPA